MVEARGIAGCASLGLAEAAGCAEAAGYAEMDSSTGPSQLASSKHVSSRSTLSSISYHLFALM